MGWIRNPLILFFVLALAGLGSCGGGGTASTPSTGDSVITSQSSFDQWAAAARLSEPAATVATGGLPAIPYDAPVRAASAEDPNQPPDDPGLPPAPGENLNLVVLGKDYLQMHDGVVDGDALKLGFGNPAPPAPPAYGLYRVSGLNDLSPLSLNIECLPEWDSTYFVGLADYTLGAWHWFPPSNLPEYQLNLAGERHRYVTDLGNLYFIIVLPEGSQATHSRTTVIAGPPPVPLDPGCPFHLIASQGELPGAVGLIWNPGPGPQWFQVFRAPVNVDGVPAEFVMIGETPEPQFHDPNVPPGMPFAYKVRAMNGEQPSGFSNIAIGWAGPLGPPPGTGVIEGVLLPLGETAGGGVALLGAGQPRFCPVGPDGHFRFENLPAGVFGVVAQHPTREFQPALISVELPVNGSATVEFHSTPLAAPSLAWGVVFELSPGNPQDPALGGTGFVPLSGITVNALKDNGAALTTLTNELGLFFFPNLEPGHYQILAEDELYIFDPPMHAALVEGGTATPALFFAAFPGEGPPPPEGGSIEGILTAEDGTPLGGVPVHLLGLGQPLVVPTGPDGHYIFVNLPPQPYLIFPFAPEFSFAPRYRVAELPPDDNLGGVDFVGAAAAGDYVWGFIGSAADPARPGGPLAGITVKVWSAANPQQISETTTNPDGYFELGGLPPGVYLIEPVPPADMGFEPIRQDRPLDGVHAPPPAFFTAFYGPNVP